jgi:hypothetical protein
MAMRSAPAEGEPRMDALNLADAGGAVSLPVDPEPDADVLVGPEGAPVWPARTADERAALDVVAATFGARVSPTTGATAPAGRPTDDTTAIEEVVSYGPACEPLGRLYAHLTGRRHRGVRSRAAIWDGGTPSVIVTTTRLLDEDVLQRACAGGPGGSATGLIWLPEGERLGRLQVLTRAAAAALCGPLSDREVLFFPRGNLGELTLGERRVIGAKADREVIMKSLAARAGVVAISAHSDGIDVDLGPVLMLCPFAGNDRAAVAAGGARPPRCQMTGHCHRLDGPVPAALGTGKLVPADVIAARILILYVCQGLLHSDGMVHPTWGILPRLLANPGIGAVVTSWSFIFASPEDMATLSSLASSGLPLGRALGEYNRSQAVFDLGQSLCLLGDPRLRLPLHESIVQRLAFTNAERGVRVPPTAPSKTAPERTARRADHAFIRACIPPRLDDLPYEQGRRALHVLEALGAYENASWRDLPVEGGETQPGASLRAAFIDYVLGGGAQTLGLAESAAFARSMRGYRRPGDCFCCGRRLRSVLVSLRISDARSRRMDICPRCGITADAPPGLRVSMRVRAGKVELSGPLPTDRWAAGLYVKAWQATDSFGSRWPTTPSGAPCRETRIAAQLPPGQLRLYLYLMTGESLAIASCPWRRELSGSTSNLHGGRRH